MDIQPDVSKDVIDHRPIAKRAATHGIAALLGAMLACLGLSWLAPSVFGKSGKPDAGVLDKDPDRELLLIASTALDRGQAFWTENVTHYRRAKVVSIAPGGEDTPCGPANEGSGPFYCPSDERIYLDLRFLRDIKGSLGRAYVIAHELGHHVQKLRNEFVDNRPSSDVELEADCYAGAWMQRERDTGHLGAGDLRDALDEARAVGDDAINPNHPEVWDHGTSDQREAALERGATGGACR